MSPSARTFTCTSLLVAATALAGGTPPDPAAVATAELEAKLARKPIIYLVLDPPRQVLEIKSQGIVLDSISLEGIEVVRQQRFVGGASASPMTVPEVWAVTSGPGDTDRELIAPSELKPYQPEEEQEDVEAVVSGTPAPTATPTPEPPATYRVHLDNGWDLLVCQKLPARGWWPRFVASVRDGWLRLRGHATNVPPAVALAMRPHDARRLRHLMRTDTPILVAWTE